MHPHSVVFSLSHTVQLNGSASILVKRTWRILINNALVQSYSELHKMNTCMLTVCTEMHSRGLIYLHRQTILYFFTTLEQRAFILGCLR